MKTKKEMAEQIERLESQLKELRISSQGFNKYKFVDELKEELELSIESGHIEKNENIENLICQCIDNACIYYKTCFEIAIELNATDFTCFDIGEAKNISQLANNALYEYVYEELDINELERLIKEKQS